MMHKILEPVIQGHACACCGGNVEGMKKITSPEWLGDDAEICADCEDEQVCEDCGTWTDYRGSFGGPSLCPGCRSAASFVSVETE